MQKEPREEEKQAVSLGSTCCRGKFCAPLVYAVTLLEISLCQQKELVGPCSLWLQVLGSSFSHERCQRPF